MNRVDRQACVRLDKWLRIARVFKTRTRATQACSAGRVLINGQPAKAHRRLALEDRVEVGFGDWSRVLVVKQLRDRSVPRKLVPGLYEDRSLPRPKMDRVEKILAGMETRNSGAGRPTKRDRRALARLKGKE